MEPLTSAVVGVAGVVTGRWRMCEGPLTPSADPHARSRSAISEQLLLAPSFQEAEATKDRTQGDPPPYERGQNAVGDSIPRAQGRRKQDRRHGYSCVCPDEHGVPRGEPLASGGRAAKAFFEAPVGVTNAGHQTSWVRRSHRIDIPSVGEVPVGPPPVDRRAEPALEAAAMSASAPIPRAHPVHNDAGTPGNAPGQSGMPLPTPNGPDPGISPVQGRKSRRVGL